MFGKTICIKIGACYKMKSIAKNSVLNAFKSFSNLFFPLITFSYVSRIIGSEGLGRVDFAKSYIAYFSILAMLGITNYATREAAKLRDNQNELSKFTHEILFINMISVFISYIILGISFCFISKLNHYRILLIIFSSTIILNALGMEWLYNAEEDYAYITARTFIFQILSLALMIIFVKGSYAIYAYAIIQVISSTGSNIFNFIHSKKYINFKWMKNYNCIKHLKSILKLFTMTLFVQVFTHLDMTMLGFIQNDSAVGLYSAANKLSNVISSVMIACTAVLTPRIAYYFTHGKKEKVLNIVSIGLNYLLMISIPACMGLFLLAPQIITLFSGKGFLEATLTSRIMALRVFLVPLNTFFIVHYSIPIGKENRNIFVVAVAAIFNFILNMIYIPTYSQNGAAVSTVIAEFMELVLNLFLVSKEIPLSYVLAQIAQYIFATIIIGALWGVLQLLFKGYVLMIIYIFFAILIYFGILLIIKNKYVMYVIDKLKIGKRD